MTRYGYREKLQQPSLVPLADMLSNLVGIMLFILVFIVLTAGGAVILKRFPIEHQTKAEPLHFICIKNRLLSLDEQKLTNQFFQSIGGKPRSYDELRTLIGKINSEQLQIEGFVVQGKAEEFNDGFQKQISFSLGFTPQEGKGETITDLQNTDGHFRRVLSANDPKERFIHFFVFPDSLDIFAAARTVAGKNNFQTGWMPITVSTIWFSSGGGKTPRPQ